MRQDMEIQVSSEESSWITPPHIIEKVKNVLGEIDLDPASSVEANLIVGANKIFTKEDDSLTKDWDCYTFFINPPYGKVKNKSQADIFCRKAMDEWGKVHIKKGGILLLHNRSGYRWYEELSDCLVSVTLKERLRFINPETMKPAGQAKTSQTLFILGENFLDKFIDEFKEVGRFNFHPNLVGKLF